MFRSSKDIVYIGNKIFQTREKKKWMWLMLAQRVICVSFLRSHHLQVNSKGCKFSDKSRNMENSAAIQVSATVIEN